MDLATLDITPERAIEQLAHYRSLIAEERTAEDIAITAGLRAAARGLPVINLPDVMARGGWFPDGFPRLAVCRADAQECWVDVHTWRRRDRDTLIFTDEYAAGWRGTARVGKHRVEIDMPKITRSHTRRTQSHTVVPLIPPQHRPRRNRLHLFHVLWEVEQWDPTPPKDPALLRHIRGDLWAVMAVWDLTELERAVLSARVNT